MDYLELQNSLSSPNMGLRYTCAEQVFNAVTHADPDKLLGDLESAQYLEIDEIEDLLGIPLSESPITPRDVILAMKTLVYLHQTQVRAFPQLLPPCDEIERIFPVGSVHMGEYVRRIKAGYLIRLSKSDVSVNAFLPDSAPVPVSFDESSDARFRIEALDESKRRIILAIES